MKNPCDDIEECAADIAAAQFFEDFVVLRRPVVMRDAAARWPAMTKWTPSFFKAQYGRALVVASNTKTGRKSRCSLGEYLDLDGDESRRWYVTDWDFRKQHAELLEDISFLPQFQFDWITRLPAASRPDLYWLFIGHAGTGTPVHVDNFGTSAWLTVAYGKKTLFFFGDDPSSGKVPWGQARLSQGDVVYVPAGCRHSAENLTLCISVTANYLDGGNFGKYREFRMREWRGREILASELAQLVHDEPGLRRVRARHLEVALEAWSVMVSGERGEIEQLRAELSRLRLTEP